MAVFNQRIGKQVAADADHDIGLPAVVGPKIPGKGDRRQGRIRVRLESLVALGAYCRRPLVAVNPRPLQENELLVTSEGSVGPGAEVTGMGLMAGETPDHVGRCHGLDHALIDVLDIAFVRMALRAATGYIGVGAVDVHYCLEQVVIGMSRILPLACGA